MTRNREQILEELLVLQAQDGDSASISQLVSNWNSRLIRYAITMTYSQENAADVVQDSWIAILKGIHKLKDPAQFKSWAFRIVHHKAVDSIRRKSRRKKTRQQLAERNLGEPRVQPEPLNDSSETEDEILLLRLAISKLKPEDQSILTLFYEEGLAIKDIEQITGQSNSALKSRLFQIRKRLKQTLERKSNVR